MQIFQHISKNAVFGGGASFLLILILLFYLFGSRAGRPDAVTRIETSPIEGALGRELLTTLSRLKSTKLDTSVFSDPVFASLRDFGVEIAPQPVGRRNPFAEFQAGAGAAKGAGAGTPALIQKGGGNPPVGGPPPQEELLEFQFE